MARLLAQPQIPIAAMEPLSGPNVLGSSAGTSIGNFTQTVATYSALWRWQFTLAPMRGKQARDFRAWTTALHGGANATRWSFYDPDRITFSESGMVVTPEELRFGVPWDNGQPFTNGKNFQLSYDVVALASAASLDASEIYLSDEYWGWGIPPGTMIGFYSYFGMHVVTDNFGGGRIRIWPPLRKALDAGEKCTLDPVIAMRMESPEAVSMPRGLSVVESATITMVEVLHYDVVDFFTET